MFIYLLICGLSLFVVVISILFCLDCNKRLSKNPSNSISIHNFFFEIYFFLLFLLLNYIYILFRAFGYKFRKFQRFIKIKTDWKLTLIKSIQIKNWNLHYPVLL